MNHQQYAFQFSFRIFKFISYQFLNIYLLNLSYYESESVDFNLDGGCQSPPIMQWCVSIGWICTTWRWLFYVDMINSSFLQHTCIKLRPFNYDGRRYISNASANFQSITFQNLCSSSETSCVSSSVLYFRYSSFER